MKLDMYDVTSAAILKEEATVALALFDNRYNSILLIRPMIRGGDTLDFNITEPKGAERLYWMEKFGMITEEDFLADAAKLKPMIERKKLYESLKGEFDKPKKE